MNNSSGEKGGGEGDGVNKPCLFVYYLVYLVNGIGSLTVNL